MAKNLLSIEEVCKELQLDEDQVKSLVQSGALRGFLDQQTYKFRPADLDAYKSQVEAGATEVLSEEDDEGSESSVTELSGALGSDTSKVDLADIEAEEGADESDQTSVMAPTDEDAVPKEESPVFEFSESDLGLSLDEEPVPDEGDQTSLLAPMDGNIEKEESPVFEFDSDSDMGSSERASVLVADESESSLDILEVADESSSDSESEGTDMAVAEEGSSGDAVAALGDLHLEAEEPATAEVKPIEHVPSDTDTVADILSDVEESSDEALETIDLDEMAEVGEDFGAAPGTEAAETIPLSDEVETVGISAEDDTRLTEGILEEGEFAEVEGREAELIAEPEAEESPLVAAGWEIVVPSKLGNACLIAAVLLLAVASLCLFCEVFGISGTSFTQQLVDIFGNIPL